MYMKLSVEGHEYPLDLTSIRTKEAIALQKATGFTVKQLMEALQEMDAVAITGIVWLAWSRAGNKIEFDDVDFDLMSVQIEEDTPSGKPTARPKKATK